MKKLYALGANDAAQLGIGNFDDKVWSPQPCIFAEPLPPADDTTCCIATGGKHSLVLFKKGIVYAAGSSINGLCRVNTGESPSVFRRVEIPSEKLPSKEETPVLMECFRLVSATFEASFLVSADGLKIYACGRGAKGELGLGEDVTEAIIPIVIPDFPPTGFIIDMLASGMRHTVVRLSNGDVYGWGVSRHGQLGEALVNNQICWLPTKIECFGFHVTQLACGKDFSIACGGRDGAMEYRVVGRSNHEIMEKTPVLQYTDRVFSSWNTLFALTHNGKVVCWGRNDKKQKAPKDLPLLASIAAGTEHAVGLTRDQKVVAWGWGEHGECGRPATQAGSPESWAELTIPLAPGEQVVGVGAGYATTWVYVGDSRFPE